MAFCAKINNTPEISLMFLWGLKVDVMIIFFEMYVDSNKHNKNLQLEINSISKFYRCFLSLKVDVLENFGS